MFTETLGLRQSNRRACSLPLAERDASQEALEQVQKITDSEWVNGEDLRDLKRQLREAKEREAKRSAEPPRDLPEKFVSRFVAFRTKLTQPQHFI